MSESKVINGYLQFNDKASLMSLISRLVESGHMIQDESEYYFLDSHGDVMDTSAPYGQVDMARLEITFPDAVYSNISTVLLGALSVHEPKGELSVISEDSMEALAYLDGLALMDKVINFKGQNAERLLQSAASKLLGRLRQSASACNA